MNKKVLIVGGTGRIGHCVARDLRQHTTTDVIVTGRKVPQSLDAGLEFISMDLQEQEKLRQLISSVDLVIHCAGPFHYRDGRVLQICIEEGVNYIDVSDHRSFFQKVLTYRPAAEKAGITAIVNTGIFPGISNSIVRQGVEKLDTTDTIHLSYVVSGSGGAGLTVMRTTFLGLKKSFSVWLDRQWKEILPYTDRETIQFPHPYGKTGVYWFDMPEAYTFAESFQVKNVITKFGSLPDFYNHLTWITAHIFPRDWVETPRGIEFFSKVSYNMTKVTDKFTGVGVAMRAQIEGQKAGKNVTYEATMVHPHTSMAAGCGTGSVAQFLLEGKINQPGIRPVEQVLPTDLFQESMKRRGIVINESWR
ncbi:MAG: hypothetical protein N5P05_003022 [Chroococcopsis gigantea SAG 12.99]|nr:hypothetical protein [Chroococcopsis gigantea SAG 12.99]